MKSRNLVGERFTRWTVRALDDTIRKPRQWHCRCDCGVFRVVIGYSLTSGASRSCGCLAAEETVGRQTKHGMYRHQAYQSWRNMHCRCDLVTDPNYSAYGGRGITICPQWKSFEGFWADMGRSWVPGTSIDRIDVNGNYEPSNCRWATPRQQANNRRNHRMIETPKGRMNVSQAAEIFGITRSTIMRRMNDGWPEHRLTEPVQFSPRWHNPNQE